MVINLQETPRNYHARLAKYDGVINCKNSQTNHNYTCTLPNNNSWSLKLYLISNIMFNNYDNIPMIVISISPPPPIPHIIHRDVKNEIGLVRMSLHGDKMNDWCFALYDNQKSNNLWLQSSIIFALKFHQILWNFFFFKCFILHCRGVTWEGGGAWKWLKNVD